jgi:hypothetical protein
LPAVAGFVVVGRFVVAWAGDAAGVRAVGGLVVAIDGGAALRFAVVTDLASDVGVVAARDLAPAGRLALAAGLAVARRVLAAFGWGVGRLPVTARLFLARPFVGFAATRITAFFAAPRLLPVAAVFFAFAITNSTTRPSHQVVWS